MFEFDYHAQCLNGPILLFHPFTVVCTGVIWHSNKRRLGSLLMVGNHYVLFTNAHNYVQEHISQQTVRMKNVWETSSPYFDPVYQVLLQSIKTKQSFFSTRSNHQPVEYNMPKQTS